MLTIRPSHSAVFESIEQLPGYAKSKVKGFSTAKSEKKFLKIRNIDHKGLIGKLEKIDSFEIKLPSIFIPAKIKRPISERKDHSVHPFPRMGSGHGVYVYQNKYFRYEGEWRNGLKHGQGKLEMSNGTYYSGQFTNGEIEGHGFKFFSDTKDEYTGHFVKGEMQGKGKMVYFDGSSYEGEWHRNKKNGYGVMHGAGPETYEGSYFRGMRNGYGLMFYKNGNKYQGYWNNDSRTGHGVLRFADGTIYDGEFMGDVFHGQGLMRHSSGVKYEGEWSNGFPLHMASKIVIIVEEVPEKKLIRKRGLKIKSVPQPEKKSNMIIIHQGVAFKIKVECRNENDELIEDEGRELRITAGFRYCPPKNSDFDDSEENLEERPIETPFGYSVVPYPITDQIDFHSEETQDFEADNNSRQASIIQEDMPETQITEEDHGDEENPKHKDDEDDVDNDEDIKDTEEKEEEDEVLQSENPKGSNEILHDSGDQSNVSLHPPVGTKRTHKGACQWEELHLAPAPPNYGPFMTQEKIENEKKLKRPSSKKEVSSTPSFSRRKSSRTGGKNSVTSKDMLEQFRQQKKKALEEKYAKTGDYVLMVHDVTNPPYLEKTLAPAFLHLKLKQPEVEKKKDNRSKWSTADLIIKSMRESLKSTSVS